MRNVEATLPVSLVRNVEATYLQDLDYGLCPRELLMNMFKLLRISKLPHVIID